MSNIARSLKEDIPLIKTENRLSHLKALEPEAELTPQWAKMASQRGRNLIQLLHPYKQS